MNEDNSINTTVMTTVTGTNNPRIYVNGGEEIQIVLNNGATLFVSHEDWRKLNGLVEAAVLAAHEVVA